MKNLICIVTSFLTLFILSISIEAQPIPEGTTDTKNKTTEETQSINLWNNQPVIAPFTEPKTTKTNPTTTRGRTSSNTRRGRGRGRGTTSPPPTSTQPTTPPNKETTAVPIDNKSNPNIGVTASPNAGKFDKVMKAFQPNIPSYTPIDNIRSWDWKPGGKATFHVVENGQTYLYTGTFDGKNFKKIYRLHFSSKDNIRGWSLNGSWGTYAVVENGKTYIHTGRYKGKAFYGTKSIYGKTLLSHSDNVLGWHVDGNYAYYFLLQDGKVKGYYRPFDGSKFTMPAKPFNYNFGNTIIKSFSMDEYKANISYHKLDKNTLALEVKHLLR